MRLDLLKILLVDDNQHMRLLLTEILTRIGATIATVEAPWGEVVPLDAIAQALAQSGAKVIATVHGDTSTTMAQPGTSPSRFAFGPPRPPTG